MMFWLAEVLEQWLGVGRLQSKAMRLNLIEAPAMGQEAITGMYPAGLMRAEIGFPVVVGHPSQQHRPLQGAFRLVVSKMEISHLNHRVFRHSHRHAQLLI